MVKDAEANAEADKKRKELVEAKNQAESLIHTTKKSLEEHGDKVDGSTVEAIELAVGALEDALKSEDAGKIKGGIQNLMDASMKLGEAIYKASQSEGGARMPTPKPVPATSMTRSSMPISRISAKTSASKRGVNLSAGPLQTRTGRPLLEGPGRDRHGET
jgi:hypothetical protein